MTANTTTNKDAIKNILHQVKDNTKIHINGNVHGYFVSEAQFNRIVELLAGATINEVKNKVKFNTDEVSGLLQALTLERNEILSQVYDLQDVMDSASKEDRPVLNVKLSAAKSLLAKVDNKIRRARTYE